MYLYDIFSQAVKKAPSSSGARFEDEKSLSYQEIKNKADALAAQLALSGIKTDTHVAVILERSLNPLLVMLALSKLYAVNIPISTDEESRIDVIGDATLGVTHIISESDALRKLKRIEKSKPEKATIIDLTTLPPLAEMEVIPERAPRESTQEELAYIIHSSGTTGIPKGVKLSSRGLHYWQKVMLIKTPQQQNLPVARIAANMSLGFDASWWEVLMAFTFGAELCIVDEDTRKNPTKLVAFIIKHKISDITITPSMLTAMKESDIPHMKEAGLARIYITAEKVTKQLVEPFIKNEISCINCYGPTELVFGAEMNTLHGVRDFLEDAAPIALPKRPVRAAMQQQDQKIITLNTKTDKTKSIQGQLLLSAPHMARGYTNQPWAAKLIKHGKKQYFCTGDNMIFQNGFLYYDRRLSEKSHVKIRGQFVDVLGTENLLRGHPEVKDACVVVSETKPTTPILVAYVIKRSEKPLEPAVLQEYLAEKLPIVAVPMHILYLTALPLTSNGKRDRNVLSQRALSLSVESSSKIEPSTELQHYFLTLLQSLLKTKEPISINTPFSTLGINSISLAEISGRIQKDLKITLCVSSLAKQFFKLTIEFLAYTVITKHVLNEHNKYIICLKEGARQLSTTKKERPPLFFIPPLTGEAASYT